MGEPQPADVVLLAAGRSSRMGQPKGLVVVEGRPWIAHQLEALASARGAAAGRVILVLGHDRERYFEAVLGLGRSVDLVDEPGSRTGPLLVAPGGSLGRRARTGQRSSCRWTCRCPPPRSGRRSRRRWRAVPTPPFRCWTGGAAIPCCSGRPWSRRSSPVPPAVVWTKSCARSRTCARVPVDDRRVRLNLNTPGDWGKVPVGG